MTRPARRAGAPDLRRAERLVKEMMPIPGPSCQESEVAEYIRGQLRDAGAPDSAIRMDRAGKKTPLPGDSGNLVLKLPGKGPRRMFSAHMDTVPICVGSRPVRRGGVYRSADPTTGLGADDRAGSAVVLNTAWEVLAADRPHPPLTFCWFVQEEIGLQGSRVVEPGFLGRPAMAFNWDGGSPLKMTVGATGGYRMEIEIAGLASHAGNAPEQGVSAIAIAGLAIADLQRRGWHGLISKGKRRGTSNIGAIQGGGATNVVTDKVVLRVEARSHDPAFRRQIVQEIESAFSRAAEQVVSADGRRGKVGFNGRLDYESFRLSHDEACVQAAEEAVRELGGEPVRAITNGGVDANWLHLHGIPTVTLGCGQVNPHMTSEALNLQEFFQACRIAHRLALGHEAAA